jgi:sugar/nucleoside kinase (ribokinase family)
MKKYDVVGISNALVDIEFKVTNQFFTEKGVEKGLMILVDEERQNELMKVINTSSAKKQCGGSAGNTRIAVSQFEGKSCYSCKVADDELGHFYMNYMKDAGVTHNLNETSLTEGITGKYLVMVTEDAERNMNTFFRINFQNFSDKNIFDSVNSLF